MIYIINIILIICWGLLLLGYKTNKNKKLLFCIIATVQWVLLSGLRHITVGADTESYKISFETTQNWSWNYIFNRFNNILFNGAGGKDPGYAIFEKLCQYISVDYQVYLFIIALLFTVPLGILIYKYSKNPCISFLVYSCLFYSFFAITGHRQTIATGVALLLGYEFIKRRYFWHFIFLICLTFTIHKSVMCLIPFYFIANKKITFRYSIIMLMIFIIVFIFKNEVMILVANFSGYEEFASQFEGAGSLTFTLMFIVITLCAIWKAPQILKNSDRDITIWYNAIFVALIFLPLTFVDPSAMRTVQYFSIFIILLIPEIVKAFSIKDQPLIYYVGGALMILLLAKSNPQYLFFWQG